MANCCKSLLVMKIYFRCNRVTVFHYEYIEFIFISQKWSVQIYIFNFGKSTFNSCESESVWCNYCTDAFLLQELCNVHDRLRKTRNHTVFWYEVWLDVEYENVDPAKLSATSSKLWGTNNIKKFYSSSKPSF